MRNERAYHSAKISKKILPIMFGVQAAIPTTAVPTAAIPTAVVPTAVVPTTAVPTKSEQWRKNEINIAEAR